ncbi:MAG: DUF6502 family protein [Marinobacterium sp.]|nr:DUF6502 family protein [Marinobacterium sp.]
MNTSVANQNGDNRVMTAPTPPPALIRAIRRLLRPLIRLLLEYGVTFPFLSNLLKNLFVEVVNEEMQVDGKRQTLSRISVVSGVHRKDVKRILEEKTDSAAPERKASLGSRLFGLWLGDPRYQDKNGKPCALPRTAPEGEISFEQLVVSVNRDVRPRAILDEWLRTGLVQQDINGNIHLDPDAFVTEKNFDERAHFFGRNMRDHMAAGAYNLMPGNDKRMLERAVFYDELTPESAAQLQTLAHKLAMDTLHQLNEEALRLASQDEGKSSAKTRMTFGTFYFQQEESSPTGAQPPERSKD